MIHCRLAWAIRFQPEFDHAAAALELAERLDDAGLRRGRRCGPGDPRLVRRRCPAPRDLAALTQQLPGSLGGERLVQEATQAIVNTLAPAPERHARSLFQGEYAEWRERDEPRSARALWGLAWVEFWAGRWELAAEHAARAHEIASQYGHEVPQDHLPIAVIAVHRGQLELAREHSERALALADEQFGFHPPQHVAVLGMVALGGVAILPPRSAISPRPTGGRPCWAGASRACGGGRRTTSSSSSSRAASTTPSTSSTSGPRTQPAPHVSGRSLT